MPGRCSLTNVSKIYFIEFNNGLPPNGVDFPLLPDFSSINVIDFFLNMPTYYSFP